MAAGENGVNGTGSELLLAQVLDAYLAAESVARGTGAALVAGTPEPVRATVGVLAGLAGTVSAAGSEVVPSPSFRASARARLMVRLADDVLTDPTTPIATLPANVTPISSRRREIATWAGRVAAGLVVVCFAGYATVNASASSLPGDPFYGVKQAREALQVSLAPDDDARALALLQQANARVDEAARLVAAGKADGVDSVTQRYDDTIQQVTALVADDRPAPVTSSPSTSPEATVEAALTAHQERLEAVLASAPPAAKPGLERALEASAQGLARAKGAHGPEPETVPGSQGTAGPAAPVPTATLVATPVPPAVAPVATAGPNDERGRSDDGEPGEDRGNRGRGPDGTGAPGQRGRPEAPGKPQAVPPAPAAQATSTPTAAAPSEAAEGDSGEAAGSGRVVVAPSQSPGGGRSEGRGAGAGNRATDPAGRPGSQAAPTQLPDPQRVTPTPPSGNDRLGPPTRPAQGQGLGQDEGQGRGRGR